MPVNPAVEGRTYRMPQAHVVTRDEIVTFARAVRTSDDRCLDVDAARAVRLAGAEPVSLWHKDADLHGVDAIVVPGGFSYGDYLRAGAIARFAPASCCPRTTPTTTCRSAIT
mgnify:CR=1 FL=1